MGGIALGLDRWATAVLSLLGYVIQTIFDHVTVPHLLAEVEFYALFTGFAAAALVSGAMALIFGWQRRDLTVSLGFLSLAYVLAAQLTQSLWD